MKNLPQVESYLTKLGLSDIEAKLYLGILQLGPSTVLEISKYVGIKRTTAHVNIENLIQKGFAAQTKSGSRRRIVAEPPEKLEFLIEQRKLRIKELEKDLDEVVGNLQDSIPNVKEKTAVEIKYYKGIKEVRDTYKRIARSKAKQIFTILNAEPYFEIFPETHDVFKKFLDENPDSHIYEILVGNTSMAELKSAMTDIGSRCIYKFGKSTMQFPNLDFLIYNNEVVMIQITKDTPSAIHIQSEAIAGGLKGIHQMLWQFLPENNS